MFHKAVHIFMLISLLALVGCGKAAESDADNESITGVLYDNPELGIRVLDTDGWVIEKETAKSVKFTNEKIVAIISVIPKGDTVGEIKQALISSAGEITVTGEGANFISWKSERNESIHTNIFIEEKQDRNVIITFLTPNDAYETNRETIEAFRWNVELY